MRRVRIERKKSSDMWWLFLSSGNDNYPGCRLSVCAFKWYIAIPLPPIIKPYQEKVIPSWSAETVARLGRDYYFQAIERQYGFSFITYDGHLCLRYGRMTDDSRTEQSKGFFLPWMQQRFFRHSLYGLTGEWLWTDMTGKFEALRDAQISIPKAVFKFQDYDGEIINAETHIEEIEWRLGEGWFKWLSWFRKPKIRRFLDINFTSEVGKKKGTWKGGILGTAINLLPGELHESAFRRYCDQNELTFLRAL